MSRERAATLGTTAAGAIPIKLQDARKGGRAKRFKRNWRSYPLSLA